MKRVMKTTRWPRSMLALNRNVAVLSGTGFLAVGAWSSWYPILPLHLRDLGATDAQVGLAYTLMQLGFQGIQLVGGLLADRFGPKRVIFLDSGRCRFPHRARPAMEAMGIDVVAMINKAGWDAYALLDDLSLVPCAVTVGIVFLLSEVKNGSRCSRVGGTLSLRHFTIVTHIQIGGLTMTISLKGTIKTQAGTPIEGASVRLIGSDEPLGHVGPAAVRRPGAVSWTRTITGFSGHRWNCWQKFVMNQVAGITWDEFKEQVVEHNPDLIADGYVFKADKSYRLPEQVTEQPVVDWTRTITGFSGNRWNCWKAFVQGKVDGLTWDEFKDQVVEHNPDLIADGYVFKADKTYVLPENVLGPTEVTWTRPLTGFSGNRWQCWEAHVRDQVQGLTWAEFMQAVVERNPTLPDDGYVFKVDKAYVLPENRIRPLYYLFTLTDQAGRYALEGLTTPGDYELLVEAPGYHPYRERLSLEADTVHDVILTAIGPKMVSHWEGYPTAPVRVQKLIDQALNMLGDDPVVFDSLSPELRRLATGSFYSDPQHFHHKDIVCADLVTICLAAAGVDYHWQVTEPPGTPYNTSYAANYYRPAPNHPKLRKVAEDEDWLPGDILVYWNGNLASERVLHVNLYVGPFSGTDLSGNVHPSSKGYEVVNASIDHLDPSGAEVGTAIRPVTKDFCLANRFGYQHVQRMRHVDL